MSDTHKGKQGIRQGNEPADGVLVGQAVAGDERAFEALVNRYRHTVLNYIQRILKDNEQANDILQGVMLQLYLSLPTLQMDVPIQPWLLSTVKTYCYRSLQRLRPILANNPSFI